MLFSGDHFRDFKEALGLNSVSKVVTLVLTASRSKSIDYNALVKSKKVIGLGFVSSSESIACYFFFFFFFLSEPDSLPLPLELSLPLSEPLFSSSEPEPLPDPDPLPLPEPLSEPLPLSSSFFEASSLSTNLVSYYTLAVS